MLGIDTVCVLLQGGGSGLLRREKTLESVIRCMNNVINLPLTVKTRTGVYANKNLAHTLMPKFQEWGASLVTVSLYQGCRQTLLWSVCTRGVYRPCNLQFVPGVYADLVVSLYQGCIQTL